MKSLLKKIVGYLPVTFRRIAHSIYVGYHRFRSKMKMNRPAVVQNQKSKSNDRVRVLIYHIEGLGFGGTQKSMQIFAKHLNKQKYDVFFMHSPDNVSESGRKKYLKGHGINFVPFTYASKEDQFPFFVHDMNPHILDIIEEKNIDLVITANTGYEFYPINIIESVPIIMMNIFGSPNTQNNIVKNICVSKTIARKISPEVPNKNIEVMYNPTETPDNNDYKKRAQKLQKEFNISDEDIVFGRIGRPSDAIFDSIGIDAFAKTVKKNPKAHYMIMAPPPKLVSIVKEESIPNVHFIDPSYEEVDVWGFHEAIDVLAHFRNDGETCGLNIGESMMVGNPVITHKSHMWNAHLEYLDDSFARIAGKDDTEEYAKYMSEFIKLHRFNQWKDMRSASQEKAAEIFDITNQIPRLESWIDEAVDHA